MLDALSALKYRLISSFTPQRGHRRAAAALRLLEVNNRTRVRSATHLPGTPPPRPPKPDSLQRFALPSGHVQLLVPLMQKYRRLLDSQYAMPLQDRDQGRALETFFTTRAQLVDAALGAPAHALGVRRPWPDLSPPSSHARLLERLFQCSHGLVIGENHAAQGSKRLLIDHMAELRRLGITTLYLEHMQSDLHQDDLDRLHATGVLAPGLDRFLAGQDAGHNTHAATGATFRALVQAAAQAGIRIVALDLMASYHLGGAQGATALDSLELRIKVMNHVAAQRIAHDQRQQRAHAPAQRWVALVGDAHAGDFNDTVGLAERLGVPSLRVEDISPSFSQRVRVGSDPVRTVPGSLGRTEGTVQCDYLLQVPARDGRARKATPGPCSAAEALRQHEQHQARYTPARAHTA
ncbi:membrane-targeted effector domain-containing toxin [uncultured Stenotrophomonas sp.]|uniref:membrane-targeted effector domain-containing toxin n=1 Tax=uncultured Stenotrophomonas sp. TaxID=165438 RepID=UPI0028E227F1|nr:membrane-targeted effector domain-containing toxin [uncultured Stenotrophomonas sp.]